MASTITETFDAPMTDSGDIDVSMFHGVPASDSWLLSVEASMGDEGFIPDSASFAYAQEDVEIEMGDDDEPITEYEMADEDAVYDASELQDVEVYDISEAPSPLHTDQPTVDTSVENTELMALPSSDGPQQTNVDLHIVHVESSTSFSTFDDVPPTFPVEHVGSVVSTSEEPGLDPAADIPPVVIELPQADSNTLVQDRSIPPEPLAADVGQNVGEPQDPDDGLQPVTFQVPIQPPESLQSGFEVTQQAGGGDDAAVSGDNHSATANDPHEISEGVYIDPPPPVLLSLPPSAAHAEYALFNLPTKRRSQSPSGSNQPDDGVGLPLLLQDRPTLYYEPLSAVFTALRQEQCVQELSQFSEAELVLDAFDLQLTISEDNVYTHEVTLHELDVIHDGSDIRGPLRLRLKLFAPRFVTRYTALRDQIARLDVAEDGDQAQTDDALSRLPTEQEYVEGSHKTAEQLQADSAAAEQVLDEPADAADTRHEDHVEGDMAHQNPEIVSQDIVQQQPEVDAIDAVEQVDVYAIEQQAVVENVLTSTARAESEQLVGSEVADVAEESEEAAIESADEAPESAAVAGTEVAEGAEVFAEEPEDAEDADADYDDDLDANELHMPAAEEAGDYVEHAEFPDDEDEFGDDPSEEAGAEEYAELSDNVVAVTEEAAGEGRVEEQHEVVHEDDGLHVNASTDFVEHSNSAEASESLHPSNETRPAAPLPTTHDSRQEPTVMPEPDELNDDWDDDVEEFFAEKTPLDNADALSRRSSSATLSSKASKRAYEEVELQEFDDEDFGTAPSSPDAKRARLE